MHQDTAQSFYINYTVAPEAAAQNIIIVLVARAHVCTSMQWVSTRERVS
jgi:hypothetical protein